MISTFTWFSVKSIPHFLWKNFREINEKLYIQFDEIFSRSSKFLHTVFDIYVVRPILLKRNLFSKGFTWSKLFQPI